LNWGLCKAAEADDCCASWSAWNDTLAMTFSQGDFNYDGKVNALDFNVLATKFGTYLAPASPAEAVTAAAPVRSTQTPSLFADEPLADDPLIL
jgi:hypothetical protein